MVPELDFNINEQETEITIAPSKTYKLDLVNKRIIGQTDGLEAYKIAAEKALRTQRYAHVIYSGDYGSEIVTFVGMDFEYIKAAIQVDIHQTLSSDDRYQGISDFIITQTSLDSGKIKFNIICSEGTVPMELFVEI